MNLFAEEKVHAQAEDGSARSLCGASGNNLRRLTATRANVTCLRCLKKLAALTEQGRGWQWLRSRTGRFS
jgi:hypothetical protein